MQQEKLPSVPKNWHKKRQDLYMQLVRVLEVDCRILLTICIDNCVKKDCSKKSIFFIENTVS